MEYYPIIHYCWFGNNELPELTKKCIESWKKFLPNCKIIKWSEENFDVNQNEFVKQAYQNKKWAFVADYVRAQVLNEYGGIYFDTDMEVIKDISEILKYETVLGIEDTGLVAAGFWYEKNKKSELTQRLLKKYSEFDEFNVKKINNYIITELISGILEDIGWQKTNVEFQLLNNQIAIYPRDYFYPYSYNDDNMFTENTCMIHYYDGSWLEDYDKKIAKSKNVVLKKCINIFGEKKGELIGNLSFKLFYYPFHPITSIKKLYSKIKK